MSRVMNNMPMSARCRHVVSAMAAVVITGVSMAREGGVHTTESSTRVESETAEQATDQVRVQRVGTVVALFVKPGDPVKKGQVLGHTELDQAKLNLDTAAANLESEGTLNQMYWQHQAMIHSREDAEDNARKRLISQNRLQQALSMEK